MFKKVAVKRYKTDAATKTILNDPPKHTHKTSMRTVQYLGEYGQHPVQQKHFTSHPFVAEVLIQQRQHLVIVIVLDVE